ncbi:MULTISPECIES: OPT family oligopeptide transporter [Sphingobium]|nr:oligopeptide transporter, OPT family [Sphingobium sp. JAI105]TWD10633.1 putative OPT family oligopeptide transporter [Sphingobium sp. AEW010]TWD27962.1 putative OPT family oligopeptide transporter [Sphingobium sp. AEW013]TWD28967.1 putative OPT family oligopeptide transporter [Sphingobium sp. AEW001]
MEKAQASAMAELTLRGVILGALITLIFTAANVYLGLKIGLTFATSIPAAVISMAVLRLFATGTILENNIVQTIASAAGTLSAIIFVLPGLVIIGWWQGFPYWLSACTIALGGILGVMYSVPLRRALVTGSPLPYPEGVAAAEVLKVGAGSRLGEEENKRGLSAILLSALAAAAFSIVAKTRLLAEEAATFFKFGAGATSMSTSFSMALIGVGHLVGLSVGVAMFVGLLISWVGIVPYLTAPLPAGADLADLVGTTFRMKARFIGAGTIGVAAIWTLLKILGPIVSGIRSAMVANATRKAGNAGLLELTERDLPIGIVGGTIIASMLPIGVLLWIFAQGGPIAANPIPVIALTLAYVLVAGIVIASVCGYMAGLIGASNSPISGVGILAVLGASLMLAAIYGSGGDPDRAQALVAYALFTTAIVFGIATISNDNLQDLKTGQLVGATPWKQQIALILGVLFGALVIPPVLDLLNSAFGFAGAPGAGPNALPAPQAALISALAKGVLGGDLDWGLIGIGAGIGAVVVLVDELLGKAGKLRLPPLAVGMGIYLPMALTLLIPVGAVIGHLYNRWALRQSHPEFAERMGVLMATGFIVGESLFGVAFAGIVAATDSDTPLALVGESHWAIPLSILIFASVIGGLYAKLRRWASAPLA